MLLRNRERAELATAKRVTTLEGDEKAYFVRRLRTGQAKASPPVAFCCPVDSGQGASGRRPTVPLRRTPPADGTPAIPGRATGARTWESGAEGLPRTGPTASPPAPVRPPDDKERPTAVSSRATCENRPGGSGTEAGLSKLISTLG